MPVKKRTRRKSQLIGSKTPDKTLKPATSPVASVKSNSKLSSGSPTEQRSSLKKSRSFIKEKDQDVKGSFSGLAPANIRRVSTRSAGSRSSSKERQIRKRIRDNEINDKEEQQKIKKTIVDISKTKKKKVSNSNSN